MLRRRPVSAAIAAAVLLSLSSAPARAQVDGEHYTPGASCPPGAVAGQAVTPDWDTFFECNAGGQWQRGPYFFGASADTCDSNHAGMVQWNGSAFQGCNGSAWSALNNGGTTALSSLLAATTTNSIDSGTWAQTWAWGTLTNGTALMLTSSSITSGQLLWLYDNSTATGSSQALRIDNSQTGSPYGVYSALSGASNTGYAGYFTNAGAANVLGYGVYGTTSSYLGSSLSAAAGVAGVATNTLGGVGVFGSAVASSGVGVWGLNSYTGGCCAPVGVWGSVGSYAPGAAGVYGQAGDQTGHPTQGSGVKGEVKGGGNVPNTGYGVYGIDDPPNNGGVNWGGYFETTTTAAGYGVEGVESGTANAGYAGYFSNTATSGANYGLYATNASAGSGYGIYTTITGAANTGYAGYFSNTATTGYAFYVNGTMGAAGVSGAPAPTSAAASYSEMAGNSNNGTLATGSTYYYPANGTLSTSTTTEASAGTRTIISRAATIQNLYYVASASSTSTITIMKNGVATAITCSTSSSTTCSDTSDTVSLSASDQIGVKIVATTTAVKHAWSMEASY